VAAWRSLGRPDGRGIAMLSAVRVLVAEDDPWVAEAIKRLLDDRDFSVVGEAADGSQAIHMTRSLRPDVVLMDLDMPVVDGVEATRQIQRWCPTPVVMLTGHDSPENAERAADAGASGYLIKPPDPGAVERAIRVAVDAFTKSMVLRRFSMDGQAAQAGLDLLDGLQHGQRGESSAIRARAPDDTQPINVSGYRSGRHLPQESVHERFGDPLVSLATLQPLQSTLTSRGIVVPELRALDIQRVIAEDENPQVPLRLATRVWQQAALLSGDENLGLAVAKVLRPGDLGVLDYALRASQTLGEAVQLLVRFYPLLGSAIRLQSLSDAQGSRLRLELADPTRHRVEFGLAVLVVVARQSTGIEDLRVGVRFIHPRPADVTEHQRTFGAPTSFGCDYNELLLSHETLQLPMQRADPILSDILLKRLRALMRDLPLRETLKSRVRRLMAEELQGGDPSLESVASQMAVSPRTLRRWLHEAHTSHRDVLDGLRKDMALRHLADGQLPIADVAQVLGYSEPSAFHRTFKRWTGKSPGEYREDLRPASETRRPEERPDP